MFEGMRRRSSMAAAFRRERQIEHLGCGAWGGSLLAKGQDKKSPAQAYEACLEDFATTTTIQGLPKLADKKNGPIRFLVWLGAFVGFGYLCFAQIIPLVARYRDRETVTTMSSITTPTGFFPAVTICPSGPHFRCDCKLFSATPEISAYAQDLRCQNSSLDYVSGPDPCGTAVPGYDYDMMVAQFQELGYFRERDLSYYAAFSYSDALVYWKFGQHSKNDTDGSSLWTLVYDPSLGFSCWQFNPDFIERQRRPLELEGLFVVYDMALGWQSKLFVSQSISGGDEVGMAGWVGLSVGLQNSPQGSLQEFQSTVGQSTVVSLKRQDTLFLHGYGTSGCQENVNTSVEVCMSNCLWVAGAEQCGCPSADVGKCPTYFLGQNLGSASGQQLIDCVLNGWTNSSYYTDYADGKICRPLVDCKQPCFVSDLIASVSAYPWPQAAISDQTAAYLSTAFNRNLSVTDVQQNLVQMRIYASSFTYQLTQEVPALLVGDLLGAVGGNLGLWAGFSFLTLVEVVELLCVMFLLGCTFTCRGSAQVVNQIERKVTNHVSKDDLNKDDLDIKT